MGGAIKQAVNQQAGEPAPVDVPAYRFEPVNLEQLQPRPDLQLWGGAAFAIAAVVTLSLALVAIAS